MAASARADEEGRKVFLGGLSFDAREDDLKADFGKYGELEDVQLPNGESGRHKGFAFLTYVKAEDALEACKEHHQKEYLGREISARVVVPRGDRGGGGGGGGDRGPPRGLPELSQEMSDKLEEWVSAKRKRDFETSDRIRAEMQRDGVNPEDYRPKPGGSPASSVLIVMRSCLVRPSVNTSSTTNLMSTLLRQVVSPPTAS